MPRRRQPPRTATQGEPGGPCGGKAKRGGGDSAFSEPHPLSVRASISLNPATPPAAPIPRPGADEGAKEFLRVTKISPNAPPLPPPHPRVAFSSSSRRSLRLPSRRVVAKSYTSGEEEGGPAFRFVFSFGFEQPGVTHGPPC